MTPLCGVDSVRLQILLMGTCQQCGHGLSLATITRKWLDETPFVQVSTIWALTCPETVHQRPRMTREMETWLSDSRVGNNSVVDHRSRRPVLSPLHIVSTDVMSDHIGHRDASRGGGCWKTLAYIGQFGAASMIWSVLPVAALRCREGGATLLSTGSHESCVGCRQPEIRRIEQWSWVSMGFV